MSALGVFLDPYVADWLDLLLRWLHVIAAIAWIGTSFYFVLLDQSLREPKDRAAGEAGVAGELWEVHGGGFYHMQKYRVAPATMPEHLAWFKWEAYTTWLSGFALLVVLYYFDARTQLVDPEVADLPAWAAVSSSVALLALAWVVYAVLCRVLKSDVLLALAICGLVVLAAWGATNLFSARAAYLQVGAMLGTLMSGNVLLSIIPAHRELVRAKAAGREPDPGPGIEAKRRSVHNNYLTLPVLVTMLAGHFSFLYGHSRDWLILVVILALGAWSRLFFNLRHAGRTVWWIPATGGAAVLILALTIRPETSSPDAAAAAPFARVHAIVAERCITCHSANPTRDGVASAPAGVELDTAAQVTAQAEAIRTVVASRAMPPGNVTGMTDAERETVLAWVDRGAPAR